MRTTVARNPLPLIAALFGLLFLTLPAFAPTYAMDSDSMKMEDKQGNMMQSGTPGGTPTGTPAGTMTADEMIKKGDEMIAQGKALKKKGMMMMMKEAMGKGTMQEKGMMKGNEMKKDPMNGMGMNK